jgi:putative membrane protein
MFIQWLFAALHLLALGIGLGAIWWRARSLKGNLNDSGLRRVLYADNLWGIAALLWISTGLIRAFAGLEKGTAYYLASNFFWIKMGLLAIVLLLEIRPMLTFIQWRIRLAKGEAVTPDTRRTNQFAVTSIIQSLLIVVMVFVATGMARGIGF